MPLFFTVTCNRISRNVENVSYVTMFSLILKHVVKKQVVVYLEVKPSHLLSFSLCEKSQTLFQECTTYEPHREKTGFLPRRKQRRRS